MRNSELATLLVLLGSILNSSFTESIVARIQVDPELLKIEKLVQLKPVSKTVKGGRKRRFSALVVVGDRWD